MLSCTVYYPEGGRLKVTNRSLKEIISLICLNEIVILKKEPLKLVFQETGKTLYCDKQTFECYLNGEINEKELIEQTECDELYRNIYEVETKDGTVIDPDSLWKCKNRILTLIDDDFHASFILNEMEFCIAE